MNRNFLIGILLVIIYLGIFYLYDSINKYVQIEEFQGFSESDIMQFNKDCKIGDPTCTYISYYNTNGKLVNDKLVKNLPDNVYIDSNRVLQYVPTGYVANDDRRGYQPAYTLDENGNKVIKNQSKVYSNLSNSLSANAITDPSFCYNKDTDYKDKTKCVDTQYVTMENDQPILTYDRIRVPDGYYVNKTNDKKGILTKIPYGYVTNSTKIGITMTDEISKQVSSTSYNSNNYDTTYHSYPNISEDKKYCETWVLDQSNNLVLMPYDEVKNTTLYKEPGSFRFGSSNYVPNYEETVYLSKLTNISTVSPISDISVLGGGFCDYYKNNPDKLEQMCNDTSSNSCASTTCCVLLGGQKCVYGDNQGPKFKSNYSNFLVKNPEFYYYQGKCFGNCISV